METFSLATEAANKVRVSLRNLFFPHREFLTSIDNFLDAKPPRPSRLDPVNVTSNRKDGTLKPSSDF